MHGIFSSKEEILGKKRSDSNKDVCNFVFQSVLIFSQLPGGVQHKITEAFPVTGMRSPGVSGKLQSCHVRVDTVRDLCSLDEKRHNLWVLDARVRLSKLFLLFFSSGFLRLRSGSKQTTVTAWKVYCRWFYICP